MRKNSVLQENLSKYKAEKEQGPKPNLWQNQLDGQRPNSKPQSTTRAGGKTVPAGTDAPWVEGQTLGLQRAQAEEMKKGKEFLHLLSV